MLFETIQSRINARITRLVFTLIYSRQASDYTEHHGAYEDSCAARIGPLHLDTAHCFVLDYADASISIHLPTPWGELRLGYIATEGEDKIRQSGLYARWQKRPLALTPGSYPVDGSQDILF